LLGLLAGGVFKWRTPYGTIVLENLPPAAEVLVDGEKATVTWSSGKSAEITVKSGTRQIVAKANGIEVIGQEIIIKEGGREVLVAKIEPAPTPFPPVPVTIPGNQAPPADATPLPKEITNSIGMRLVLIPPGKFQMGSPDSDPDANPDEKPQHEVEITKAFYLGVHTVTVGQFRAFVQDKDYRTDAEWDGPGGWGYDEQTRDFGVKQQFTWKDPG
jgi:formylglycine-generating enzyme required for sulfatase activity